MTIYVQTFSFVFSAHNIISLHVIKKLNEATFPMIKEASLET